MLNLAEAQQGNAAYIESAVPELLVELQLLVCHVCVQDDLLLGRQTVLYIRLDPPQQKGLQDGMQLAHNLHQRCTGLVSLQVIAYSSATGPHRMLCIPGCAAPEQQ